MTTAEIIEKLPYSAPFHFVEHLTSISDEGVLGYYTLKKDEYFYQGHFPGNPVTPGVIITEIMAQIGLVCLGIYLKRSSEEELIPFFSSSAVDFLAPAYPGDQLEVTSEKVYFRFNKLKCKVQCKNLTSGQIVCKGELSGMMIPKQ